MVADPRVRGESRHWLHAGAQHIFSELGQGGAAYVNAEGGLSWRTNPSRPHDLYVHVVNQKALNTQINLLLVAK